MALVTRNQKLREILATSRGKTYATALLTLFVVVLMISLAVVPAYLSITNQNRSNVAKQEYMIELEQREADLKTLAQQEIDLTEEIALLNDYYPIQRNDEYIIANLTRMADEYGLELRSLAFADSQVPVEGELSAYPDVRTVGLSLSFGGELANLQRVIAHLENFPSLIRLQSISYSSDSSSVGDSNAYNMAVQAEYYYWTQPQ